MSSEIHCQQCGEPYSVYSLKNEVSDWDDQPDDAHELFMRGEGCPTCDWGEKAGEVSLSEARSEEELEAQHLQDVFRNTDEDPLKYI